MQCDEVVDIGDVFGDWKDYCLGVVGLYVYVVDVEEYVECLDVVDFVWCDQLWFCWIECIVVFVFVLLVVKFFLECVF